MIWLPISVLLWTTAARAAPVRVVLVTIDTQRAEALTPGEESPMPGVLARTESCAHFSDAWSATSTTLPTHASLFTGLHPWQHGVTSNHAALSPVWATLAEELAKAGYSTAAVVASSVLGGGTGITRGFQSVLAPTTVSLSRRTGFLGSRQGSVARYGLADEVANAALRVWNERSPGPRFLWVHFFDPHEPYGDTGSRRPLRPFEIKGAVLAQPWIRPQALSTLRHRYRADLAFLDRHLSRLVDRILQAEGPTHLMLTADHGESLGEDGSIGHGTRLNESQLRVPLIVCSPGVYGGQRDETVGSVDVYPTLRRLAGLDGVQGRPGRNLVGSVRSNTWATGMRRTHRRPYQETRLDGRRVVLREPYFFWASQGALVRGDSQALDSLGEPPSEGQAAELRRVFLGFEKALRKSLEDLAARTVPEREGLEALGYVR